MYHRRHRIAVVADHIAVASYLHGHKIIKSIPRQRITPTNKETLNSRPIQLMVNTTQTHSESLIGGLLLRQSVRPCICLSFGLLALRTERVVNCWLAVYSPPVYSKMRKYFAIFISLRIQWFFSNVFFRGSNFGFELVRLMMVFVFSAMLLALCVVIIIKQTPF